MKKYSLINIKTKEEHLCDKVTIDGFDYYVSDEQRLITDNCLVYDWHNKIIRKSEVEYGTSKKVIATNNPNFDIPQVVYDKAEYFVQITVEILLQLWQEQQPITIYYIDLI